MAVPNPISAGPKAVLRDPVILLLELLWRWVFGGVAFLVLFPTALGLMGPIELTKADSTALSSRDALQITLAFRHMLATTPARSMAIAALVLFIVTLLWISLSSAGRILILSRVAPEKRPFRLRSMLIVQTWRAMLSWLALVGMGTTISVVAGISAKTGDPDPYFFYLVATCSVILLAAFWSAINWYLSLATIFCYAGTHARGAVRETIGWVNLRGADMAGISALFVLFRGILAAAAFVFLFLPSAKLGSSPKAAFAWAFLMAFVYFALSDFLNISRLLSYMSVEDAVAEEIAQAALGATGKPNPRRPLP
jgi:hypothetical protein